MRGRKPHDTGEHRRRRDRIATEEVLGDLRAVERGLYARDEEQRARVGSERKPTSGLQKIKGLLSKPIPSKEQALVRLVPDRKRKHAVEMDRQILAPLLVSVDEHLRVRATSEAVAQPGELIPQHRVVPDLAVVDDDDRPVLVLHRLTSAGQIDDA